MRSKLGQHFLTDRRIIARILNTANIHAQDDVIEIGPGHGVLTFPLAKRAQHLLAIEYDLELATRLQQAFAEQQHVRIVHADARFLDYAALLSGDAAHLSQVKIIANLPYYAAVPILLALFEYPSLFKECTLMFQKEVAERITAAPGSKSYGILSLTAQYYAKPEWCFSIAPQAFRPRPKVESAVIKLRFFDRPLIHVLDQESFFYLIKGSFGSRRKTLKNSLAKHSADRFPGHLLHRAFEHLHFPENVRAEDLSIEDFAKLSNFLVSLQCTENVSCQ